MSVLLRIAYDGTDFHGYAAQRGADGEHRVRTVQGELERALSVLYKQPVTSRAASRTDAGVHALGQLAAYDAPFEIPEEGIVLGLSSNLPDDVTVRAAWVEDGPDGGPVDVRGGNGGKHYRYRIRCTRLSDPLTRRVEWHLGRALEPSRLERIASELVGTHDFAAFRAADCQAATTERTVTEVTAQGESAPVGEDAGPADVILIDVRGTAFLKNMVRIMVGSVVDVALGRRPEGAIRDALASGDRKLAGVTAPARGLTLVEVFWPRGP